MKLLIPSALLVAWIAVAIAETVVDREGAVRKDARKMEDGARWIYNDVAVRFAEAEKEGGDEADEDDEDDGILWNVGVGSPLNVLIRRINSHP